ncbi:SIMPL domain-containing protein [Anaerococcus jeddahensis]|uniref:SIMPL domain-containing protein n=1 Tax=Anaerococcus jeddahensis TaxID=1673719 RepID=UPI0006724D55|nr:SIMPL domain-containing protein [Anaerococcus jeddahensis]
MERKIRVTGKGKISIKPDLIRLNIKASDVLKKYEDCINKSSKSIKELRKIIENSGLNPKDLKTTEFSVDTEYKSYYENDIYKREFQGYKYIHNLYINFPNDNDLLGKVLYELSKNKTDYEFSINYTVKDTESAKNKLLAKAVDDSKTKAEILAKASGVLLGEIISIDYSWGEIEIYSNPIDDFAINGSQSFESKIDIDIEADDIDLSDTVAIVWKIQ